MRPTPGQRCAERPPTASVCLDTLWVRHAKGWFKQLGKSLSQSFALEAALGYHSNKHNKMNQLDTVESRKQSGQEMFLDIFSPTLARKNSNNYNQLQYIKRRMVTHTGIKVNVLTWTCFPVFTSQQQSECQSLQTQPHAPTLMQPNQQLVDVHKAFPSTVATAHQQAAQVASGHVALHSATHQFTESPRSTLAHRLLVNHWA